MIIKNLKFIFLFFLIQIKFDVFAEVREKNDISQPEKSSSGFFEKLENSKNKAISETQGLSKFGEPRIVSKGAKPEIKIVKDEIHFNGKKLLLGSPLELWRDTLLGNPRCIKKGITTCVWEEYGLQVGTDESAHPRVKYLNIYLSFSDGDGRDIGKQNYPEGKEGLSKTDWQVHEVFLGYLEMDGYGIDAKTKFWEVRSATKNVRNLRCGIRECSSPRGTFGDHAQMQLSLNGNKESSTVQQISIAQYDEE